MSGFGLDLADLPDNEEELQREIAAVQAQLAASGGVEAAAQVVVPLVAKLEQEVDALQDEEAVRREIELLQRQLSEPQSGAATATTGTKRGRAAARTSASGWAAASAAADSGEPMIACDLCDQWFTLRAVGLSEGEANCVDHYVCASCSSSRKGKKARTTFKSPEEVEAALEAELANMDANSLEAEIERLRAQLEHDSGTGPSAYETPRSRPRATRSGNGSTAAGRSESPDAATENAGAASDMAEGDDARAVAENRGERGGGGREEDDEPIEQDPNDPRDLALLQAVRKAMEALDMTQSDVVSASRLMGGQAAFSSYLHGKTIPRLSAKEDQLREWLRSVGRRVPPARGSASLESWSAASLAVGSEMDARDSLGDWYRAVVRQVRGDSVRVHFNDWDDEYDEWIDVSGERLAPLGSKSVRGAKGGEGGDGGGGGGGGGGADAVPDAEEPAEGGRQRPSRRTPRSSRRS